MLLAASTGDSFLSLDEPAAAAGRNVAAAGAHGVAQIVTDFGALPAAAAAALLAAIVLLSFGRPPAAAALVAGFAVLVFAGDVLKDAVARERPPGASPGLTTASFPSGHAAYATVYVAAAVAVMGPLAAARRGRLAILAAALALCLAIGLTRVVLGAHHLSDVVAGWALGAVVFGLAAAVVVGIGPMRNTEDDSGATTPPDGSSRP